jgi:hypothetical protein
MKKVRVSNRCHDSKNPGFVEAQSRGFEKSSVILAVRGYHPAEGCTQKLKIGVKNYSF